MKSRGAIVKTLALLVFLAGAVAWSVGEALRGESTLRSLTFVYGGGLPGAGSVEVEIGECCDWPASALSALTDEGTLLVELVGEPCRGTRPQAWLSAWSEICPLLELAETAYWKERGCPCARAPGGR